MLSAVVTFDANDLVETDAQKTFRSHANYLHAFATMISSRPLEPVVDALNRTATKIATAVPLPTSAPVDEAQLRGCLTRAWGTELLLATGRQVATEDELLRLINSWGVVQAYYAAYSGTQALIVAEGQARPTSHQVTQRKAVGLWVTRSFAVEPWSFAMGSPAASSTQPDGSINGPARAIAEIHPWTGKAFPNAVTLEEGPVEEPLVVVDRRGDQLGEALGRVVVEHCDLERFIGRHPQCVAPHETEPDNLLGRRRDRFAGVLVKVPHAS